MSDQAVVEQSPEEKMMSLLDEEFPDETPKPKPAKQEAEEQDTEDTEENEDTEADDQDSDEPPEEEETRIKLKRGEEEVELGLTEVKELAQKGYDYTKKTQALADDRKQLEMMAHAVKAQEQNIQQQAQLQQAFIQEIARITSYDEQIAQYEGVNWSALSDSDPVQAQKLYIQYQQLQNTRAKTAQQLQQKQEQLKQNQHMQQQMHLETARSELLKAFPDWSVEKANELKEAGKSYGFTADELAGVTDPRTVKVLADAAAWRKLQASKQVTEKKVTNKPAVVKPGTKDTKTANRARNVDQMRELRKTGNSDLAAKLIERML